MKKHLYFLIISALILHSCSGKSQVINFNVDKLNNVITQIDDENIRNDYFSHYIYLSANLDKNKLNYKIKILDEKIKECKKESKLLDDLNKNSKIYLKLNKLTNIEVLNKINDFGKYFKDLNQDYPFGKISNKYPLEISELQNRTEYVYSLIQNNKDILLFMKTTIPKNSEFPYNVSLQTNNKEYFYEEKRVFPYSFGGENYIEKIKGTQKEINSVFVCAKEFIEKIVENKSQKIMFRFNSFCSQDTITFQNVDSPCKTKLIKEYQLSNLEKDILEKTLEYYYLTRIKLIRKF